MLTDNNPFGIAKAQNNNAVPAGIMQVATPTAPMVQDEPGIADMVKGKATDIAMAKGEEALMGALAPTASAAPAAAAAGKGGAGMMAGAASMAAPVLLGGLVLSKLFK